MPKKLSSARKNALRKRLNVGLSYQYREKIRIRFCHRIIGAKIQNVPGETGKTFAN